MVIFVLLFANVGQTIGVSAKTNNAAKLILKINKKNVTKKDAAIRKGSKSILKVTSKKLSGTKKIKYSSGNKRVVTINSIRRIIQNAP